MTDIDRLERRLNAVERTIVDGDFELDELADIASITADVDRLESRLDDLERRVAEVEGAAQSFGGYVAQVDSVNERVEQRADTAIATVDRLERRLDALERSFEDADAAAGRRSPPDRSRVEDRPGTAASATTRPDAAGDSPDADRAIAELMRDASGTGDSSAGARTDGDDPANGSPSRGWSAVADQGAVEESLSSVERASPAGEDAGADGVEDAPDGSSEADRDADGTILATIRSKFT